MNVTNNRGKWTQEDLDNALEAISSKTLSERKASVQYNIPRRILRRYISFHKVIKAKMGRKFTLSEEQNADLCSRIVKLAAIGYPLTIKVLRLCVYTYCVKNKLKHQFSDINRVASYKWVRNFLKNNPRISLRKSQNLNPARAQKLNKFIVDDHFKTLHDIMERYNLFRKPERIFNIDEKGVRLNLHKEPKVLAEKGAKRIHIVGNEHAESVTVVACVNAVGTAIPPMIILKGKRMKEEYANDLPYGSTCCMTDRGYMTSKTFVQWIRHFVKYKPAGLCLVIFDGAKSHLDYDIIDVGEENDVLLYCLPSNTTHELQPLDKSVFRSFEHHWDQEVQLYWLQKGEKTINKQRFGQIFSKVWDKCMTPSNIKAGFKACGIFPFDPYIIPEDAFAPSTVTEISMPQPLATSTNTTSHCTTTVTATIIEERPPSPKPDPSTAHPDVNILSHDDEDTALTEILNEVESDMQSDKENYTFKKIIPSPIKKKAKVTNRKAAINSRGILLKKQLFTSRKETAVSVTSKVVKKVAKKGGKQNLKQVSKLQAKDSWFCEVCCENIVKDMRKCDICSKYIHEECVGLTKKDKGPFTCPNCSDI